MVIDLTAENGAGYQREDRGYPTSAGSLAHSCIHFFETQQEGV